MGANIDIEDVVKRCAHALLVGRPLLACQVASLDGKQEQLRLAVGVRANRRDVHTVLASPPAGPRVDVKTHLTEHVWKDRIQLLALLQ
ncbi:hypothetical protein D3C80_1336810 [compost metagenome]